MAYIMKSNEFINKIKDIANNYNTVYMWAVFGAPVTESIIQTKAKQYPSWYTAEKQAKFRALIGKDYFGFDCVNMIKAVLWGWNGDRNKTWGGATYKSNGVPDTNADGMIQLCKDVSSSDWDSMVPGEAVWKSGHIGVYIGNGLAIECTSAWTAKVLTSAVGNIGSISGYNTRMWTKHGKLPWIDYSDQTCSGSTSSGSGTTSTTEHSIGDIVNFTGNTHYSNANATSGSSCKPGRARITSISRNAKHPYHVIHVDSTSNVYGWVDAKDITTGSTWNVRIEATALNVRSGPGMNYSVVKIIQNNGGIYAVNQQSGIWLHLADGTGWISSNYTKKV